MNAHICSPRRLLTRLQADTAVVYGTLLVPLTALFFSLLWLSLAWETEHDSPLFLYMGFLMDRFGMVPVRDFFDYNFLGTHLVNRWIVHWFGHRPLGLRYADISLLTVLSGLTFRFLLPFGGRVAWGAVILFGIRYLIYGETMFLQREYIALIPLAMTLVSATAWHARTSRLHWIVTGACYGLMATFKPHLILGAPVLWWFLVRDAEEDLSPGGWTKRAATVAGWSAVGGSLPILAMAGYYAYYGVLHDLYVTITQYLPLYAQMDPSNNLIAPGQRWPYLLQHLFFETPGMMLCAAGLAGVCAHLFVPDIPERQRRIALLLAGLLGAYLLYPGVSGQFFNYHWIPFCYMSCLCAALCLRQWPPAAPRASRLFPALVLLFVVAGTIYAHPIIERRFHGYAPFAREGRVLRISHFLKDRLQPGDTVQPLDWVSLGAVHAMIEAEAKLATRFVWDAQFYHHMDHPYIRQLREQFLVELSAAKPRFILDSRMERPYLQGKTAEEAFPELYGLIHREYASVLESNTFVIWERKKAE